jgi:hypothetical protein
MQNVGFCFSLEISTITRIAQLFKQVDNVDVLLTFVDFYTILSPGGIPMNYTKTIRAFCQQNEGKIFDSQQMAKDYFSMIPYKTFMKILNRLEDENILSSVSKGVYLIKSGESGDADSAIIKQYAGEHRGMVVGYSMYNEFSVSDFKDKNVEIYTNVIPQGNHKNINQYHLTGANIIFSERAKKLIRTLELIEHRNDILDIDYIKYMEVRSAGLSSYSDVLFGEIVRAIRYQYSTAVTLDLMLKEIGKNDALCVDIYKTYYTGQ